MSPFSFLTITMLNMQINMMTERLIGVPMEGNDVRFPLLELPDGVLANVLQRCPLGSIAGFPLPLAMAQVRVTGSVDPNWLRPLVHLASKCPAVLDRLTSHLRSIELWHEGTRNLEKLMPQMPRLESLAIRGRIYDPLLPSLPTSLTKLSVQRDFPGRFFDALPRLTRLEELELGLWRADANWTSGVSLPWLRRFECAGKVPGDLGLFAPNLESLSGAFGPDALDHLPRTLTQLRFPFDLRFDGRLLPLSRLQALKVLALPSKAAFTDIPELLAALTALTWLEAIQPSVELLDALPSALAGIGRRLDLCVHMDDMMELSLTALQALSPYLAEVTNLRLDDPSSFFWASLTRLTRLGLGIYRPMGGRWIRSLSKLSSLRDLDLELEGRIPAGLDKLTQCSSLSLVDIEKSTNVSCLQGLTRLRHCKCDLVRTKCLANLPDTVVTLDALVYHPSSQYPVSRFLKHLTRLESLVLREADQVGNLSSLRRLTALVLMQSETQGVRLGPGPCLREITVAEPGSQRASFVRRLGDLPSLRLLELHSISPKALSTEILAALGRLSLLEKVLVEQPENGNNFFLSWQIEGLRLPVLEGVQVVFVSEDESHFRKLMR